MGPHLHGLGGPVAALLGLALAVLLLGHGLGLLVVLFLLYLLFRRRRPGPARGPVPPARPVRAAGSAIALGPGDRQAFTDLVDAIQRAWSAADLGALARLATPPMTSRFADQLADLARRGARNAVSDVRIEEARVLETWRERDGDCARVAFGIRMVDVTTDARGRVVDGSPTEHVTLREHWVFHRAAAEGWRVAAIEPE